MILFAKYGKRILLALLLATLLLLFPRANASAAPLTWCGFTWYIENDSTPTVGSRNQNSTNVWIDSSGYMHQRLRKINGIWCGAQVATTKDLGYGVYQWQVIGRPDQLDCNVAFAMFQYPRDWQTAHGDDEMDFEFSKWGIPDRKWNLDLSVNQVDQSGVRTRAFKGVMLGLPSNNSTYRLTRTQKSVRFEVFNGHVPVGQTATHLVDWLYAPSDWQVRIPSRAEPVIMNLYAFLKPPTDGLPVEMVIKSFSFVSGDGTSSGDTPSVPVPGSGGTSPVSAPSLVSPADGACTRDSTPLLDWSTVTGAPPVVYGLQVDDSADFSSPRVDDSSLTASSYTVPSSLRDGTYYWRVRAKDAAGTWGDWTARRYFVVDTVAPTAPSLYSPANGASTYDRSPLLDWSTVTDASPVVYVIQVDDNADFSSLRVGNSSLTTSSYTVPWDLSKGTYYWRVRAKDAAGNWGDWTARRYFVVQ